MASARTPELRRQADTQAGSEYLTIPAPAQAQLREKMSRFIAFAFPAQTAEEARAAIARVAADYHDARHVCWAYLLGADGATWQCNDDGEPSGTAGRPILGQIRSLGLTNVAVAVVRYFGGIKLGTSGLIVAYREAARLALVEAGTVSRCEMADLTITFPYVAQGDVMRLAKQPGIEIVDQQFDNTCRLTLRTRADQRDALLARFLALDGVTE